MLYSIVGPSTFVVEQLKERPITYLSTFIGFYIIYGTFLAYDANRIFLKHMMMHAIALMCNFSFKLLALIYSNSLDANIHSILLHSITLNLYI